MKGNSTMVSINTIFPSKWLKAQDLKSLPAVLKINFVTVEEVGPDKKPVMHFIGMQKALVLNLTNSRALAKAYGDDTDGGPRSRSASSK
jgi:hypothetical protein